MATIERLREIQVKVALPDGIRDATAYDCGVPGLCVIAYRWQGDVCEMGVFSGYADGWGVTHIDSGRFIAPQQMIAEQAVYFAHALGPLTDWTQPMDVVLALVKRADADKALKVAQNRRREEHIALHALTTPPEPTR